MTCKELNIPTCYGCMSSGVCWIIWWKEFFDDPDSHMNKIQNVINKYNYITEVDELAPQINRMLYLRKYLEIYQPKTLDAITKLLILQ
jgi:hypothetical protein